MCPSVLPSKCPRCGAPTRDALCPNCVEYLTQYHPLWLDPDLLTGPSLLDVLEPRDEAWLAIDSDADLEWHPPAPESSTAAAISIVDGVRLGEGQALLSEGDADVLHTFLAHARRRPPRDHKERDALAALCRHIASIPSMPPHLADEYATRARILSRPIEAAAPPEPVRVAPPAAEPESTAAEEMDWLLGPEEAPPPEPKAIEAPPEPEETEDLGEPEPSPPVSAEIPPPSPGPGPGPPPEPDPEPEPEFELEAARHEEEERARTEEALRVAREAAANSTEESSRLEGIRSELDREKEEITSWVQKRTKDLEVKESQILERSRTIEERVAEVLAKEREAVAKVSELEAKERDVRQRIEWAEKDDRRRAVMEFLDTVPGMTIRTAKAITNAFPDMESLRPAELRGLTQCEGVTEALAKEIRALTAPEALEAPMDLREQAQALLEEGDNEGALRVIEQHLRERPDDESAWLDEAEPMAMLERPSEALHRYNRVIDLNRANRQAWYEKANILFGAGRLVDAIDCLRQVLRLDPSKAADLLLEAEQLRIDGKWNDAALLF